MNTRSNFDWGNKSDGAAMVAVAILLNASDEETALRLYPQYAEQVVASLDHQWTIKISDAQAWIDEQETPQKQSQQQRQAIACAQLFVKHRDAKQIAKALMVTERSVYRIIKRPEFHTELDKLGYDGPRDFRKTYRSMSLKHDKARKLWEQIQQDGTPKHKRAGIISEQTHTHIDTVRRWIRGWRENIE